MGLVQEFPHSRKPKGLATILALGTSNPPNVILQKDFPDFYFRGDDIIMPDLKKKFKRICENTTIRKRHMFVTQEYLTNNPAICDYNASSLNIRQDILQIEVTKLAKEAALKAIEEWGQPKSKITHVIFTTVSGTNMPGYDLELAKFLDLDPTVQRVMLFQQGCHGGGTVLRLAKDIAENNIDARVLIVCVDIGLVWFRGPNETDIGTMVGTALFGDGAAACVVGADPNDSIGEQTFFELVSASQSFVPNSEWAIGGQLRESGLNFFLAKENSDLIAQNVEKPLINALSPLGLGFDDLNSIFWIIHPGGPAIVGKVETKLGLNKDKPRTSRHVLNEFGNMSAATVLFVMDETRKRSLKEGKSTTGDGFEYGVLLGFGPGITIEIVVLRSVVFPTSITR